MKRRSYLYLDYEVVQEVDSIRGLIPRATFINQVLKDLVAKAKENGESYGRI